MLFAGKTSPLTSQGVSTAAALGVQPPALWAVLTVETSGCANVQALVAASQDSEDAQLGAMAAFVRQAQLADSLRRGDWSQFARGYNGPDFQKNKYDQKLDLFHKRYLQGPLPDLTVRGVQLALMLKQFGGSGFVDGWFGAATQKALMRYQQQAGLAVSGAIDSATQARLWADLGW
jgi:hypothetical protein